MLPYQEVFLWAVFLSFLITLMYRIFTDPGKMRELKKDLKFYKEKMSKAQKQGDVKKTQEYTSDMMKISHKQLKINMKPMMFSMIIVIVLLGTISQMYSEVTVNLPFWFPFFGTKLSWFWWYVISTFPLTWIFRKALGVE